MTRKTSASPKKAAKQEGKRKITYVALVIDRSGSMSSVRKQAWSGLNEQIQTLRNNAELGGETYVTLIQFSDKVEVTFDKKPASELKELAWEDYVPDGGTAMYDAVNVATKRIAATREELNSTDDVGHLVIVISDGEENASKEVDANTIAAITKKLQATEKWTFTYMLSNVDLTKVQNTVNAFAGNVKYYSATAAGTANAFSINASATSGYLTTRGTGATYTANFYSNPAAAQPSNPFQNIVDAQGNAIQNVTGTAQVKLDKDGNIII